MNQPPTARQRITARRDPRFGLHVNQCVKQLSMLFKGRKQKSNPWTHSPARTAPTRPAKPIALDRPGQDPARLESTSARMHVRGFWIREVECHRSGAGDTTAGPRGIEERPFQSDQRQTRWHHHSTFHLLAKPTKNRPCYRNNNS